MLITYLFIFSYKYLLFLLTLFRFSGQLSIVLWISLPKLYCVYTPKDDDPMMYLVLLVKLAGHHYNTFFLMQNMFDTWLLSYMKQF